MFKKILAASLVLSLVSSLVLAQEAPRKAAPVASEISAEGIPILNSASDALSDFDTFSEIMVTPETHEAVFEFITETKTHVIIEYGLTPEYEYSITTEPQTTHTETIGELTACMKYYYSVRAGDDSREGDFTTFCPVVKKTISLIRQGGQKQKREADIVGPEKQPNYIPTDSSTDASKGSLLLNAAPEEQREMGQKRETEIDINSELRTRNSSLTSVSDNPVNQESPSLPGSIAFGDDTQMAANDIQNSTPVALILITLLSGMIVVFFSLKKKKKWYQK